MFRKTILAVVLSAGSLTGLSMSPSVADAHPPIKHNHHRSQRFEVRYFRGACWENGGIYRSRFEAQRVAERFRCQGFPVEIRGC